MITGIKKKNKLTEIWFDETGSAVNIRTYNTDLKNHRPEKSSDGLCGKISRPLPPDGR